MRDASIDGFHIWKGKKGLSFRTLQRKRTSSLRVVQDASAFLGNEHRKGWKYGIHVGHHYHVLDFGGPSPPAFELGCRIEGFISRAEEGTGMERSRSRARQSVSQSVIRGILGQLRGGQGRGLERSTGMDGGKECGEVVRRNDNHIELIEQTLYGRFLFSPCAIIAAY